MSSNRQEQPRDACPSQDNEDDNAEASFIPFDLLTLNDRKSSYNDTELFNLDKYADACQLPTPKASPARRKRNPADKGKPIQKKESDQDEEKKLAANRKRRINLLEKKVEELEREVASLRRNEHDCQICRGKMPVYYKERIAELIQPEEPAPGFADDFDAKRHSKDSLEFEKVEFHTPLLQTQEMEEKMWIFVGTMLIAMGSKVMDFDGTINIFKVLKQSVDKIRRQVEKCEAKIGMEFFCCKEELNEPNNLIDGMSFDPFYNNKDEMGFGNFALEGVKLESVEEYELFYDSKYNFSINYDALLTIMEYARDHCSIS